MTLDEIINAIGRTTFAAQELMEIQIALNEAVQRRYRMLCVQRDVVIDEVLFLEDMIDPSGDIK